MPDGRETATTDTGLIKIVADAIDRVMPNNAEHITRQNLVAAAAAAIAAVQENGSQEDM